MNLDEFCTLFEAEFRKNDELTGSHHKAFSEKIYKSRSANIIELMDFLGYLFSSLRSSPHNVFIMNQLRLEFSRKKIITFV
jgi:hypothetical protein